MRHHHREIGSKRIGVFTKKTNPPATPSNRFHPNKTTQRFTRYSIHHYIVTHSNRLDPNKRLKQTFTLGAITDPPTTRANRLDPNRTTQRFTRCPITNPPRSHIRIGAMPTNRPKRLHYASLLTHRSLARIGSMPTKRLNQPFTRGSIPKFTSHTLDSVRSQQTNSIKGLHDAPIDNPHRPHAQIGPIPTKRL